MFKIFNTYSTVVVLSLSVLAGCDTDSTTGSTTSSTGGTSTTGTVVSNTGTVAHKNFSLLASDVFPAVIDTTTNVFTKTDVDMTAYIGDRNNQTLTHSQTIRFYSEYGLIEPSCSTVDGACSVSWSAIKRPETGGPGADLVVNIVAVTTGEESFDDLNGNGVFDDADNFSALQDLEEPYIDSDNNGSFSAGDIIIDVVSTNDPTGVNGIHDLADGFFNGAGCTHSTLCGVRTSIEIFDGNNITISGPPPAPATP